ncbi:MAG: metallopeptidase family protein [Bacteroidales bacterium]|nr:metallopeptidase family protein [Bacteroidales bacterium]
MKRLSLSAFVHIIRQAIDSLPPEIARHLENVTVDVLDEPTEEQLQDAGFSAEEIAAGESLYGLFVPNPGISTSDMDMLDTPNQIFIYKQPLEDDFPDPQELRIEIWKTIIHEIAHHFGFSEEDLDRFEANPNPFGDRPLF